MFADIDHSNPEVRQDLARWVRWLPSQLKLGGLRLDAIKHYSADFLRSFIAYADKVVGRDWFFVGEYWREDSEVLARYIEYMHHRISLFDVRLVSNFSRVSMQDGADLRTVFEGALVTYKPLNAVVSLAALDSSQFFPIADPAPDLRRESRYGMFASGLIYLATC
jgi:alpha-amylase